MSLQSTVTPFTLGLDAVTGVGNQFTLTFDGTWRACDRPVVTLVDTNGGVQHVLGFGAVNSLTPTFLLTFQDKVYAACGETLAFSALGEPSQFQDRQLLAGEDADAPGNGTVTPGNQYGTPENIISIAHYQGRLALFARRSIQIWSMTASPLTNQQTQILTNTGTVAPLTPQSIGDLDVLYLADSGIRSLRVRDSSNNAVVVDIGTPIDSLIQAHLATLTDAQKATACAVVEPSGNRYLVFMPDADGGEGTIYVLSYFPSAQISAWSTYRPTYDSGGTQTAFIPQKFVIHDGQVFARTADGLIAYGGADGETYDDCGLTFETPWLDGQAPATQKLSQSLDAAFEGTWSLSFGMDYISGNLQTVFEGDQSTYAFGRMAVHHRGTHYKIRGEESGDGAARFSNAALHYQPGESR